jgi:hypothetical protein
MSTKQTQTVGLAGWQSTADCYAGPAGAGAIVGDFSLSLMLQSVAAQPNATSEILFAAITNDQTDGLFVARSGVADGYVDFAIQLGEGTHPAELFDVSLEAGTVAGRPVVLTFVLTMGTNLAAFVNGGLAVSFTLAHPFVPAGASPILLGGGIAGPAATINTAILGAALNNAVLSSSEVEQHALACMSAHQFTGAGFFDHAWSTADNATRGIPLALTDSGAGSPITLTANAGLPTIRYVSDVAYSSPRYVNIT